MRDFKSKVDSGNLIARVVVRISELRNTIQQLSLGCGALVDAGVQIDHMVAGSARGFEIEDDVALRIESAHISHVRVVVRRGKDVVVLRPADAFEVNAHRGSSGSGS